jgi:hypothetical protein
MSSLAARTEGPAAELFWWLVGVRAAGPAARTEPPGEELAGAGACWALATGTERPQRGELAEARAGWALATGTERSLVQVAASGETMERRLPTAAGCLQQGAHGARL